MHADRPACESEEIRFVKCARPHIHVHTHTHFTLCKLSAGTVCVVPVVILIPSEEPRHGSNELESWSRNPAECVCVCVCQIKSREGWSGVHVRLD